MMDTTIKRRLRLISFAIVICVWLVMCIQVNIKNPPVPQTRYTIGESFVFKQREITVQSAELLDGDTTKRLLSETDPAWYRELIETYASEDIGMLLIQVRIKNLSEDSLSHASGVLHGQLLTSVDTLSHPYDDVSAMLNRRRYGEAWSVLPPDDERVYDIVYYMERSWMSDTRWHKLDTEVFEILVTPYPEEIRLGFDT